MINVISYDIILKIHFDKRVGHQVTTELFSNCFPNVGYFAFIHRLVKQISVVS